MLSNILIVLLVCILTRPVGSSKYSTTSYSEIQASELKQQSNSLPKGQAYFFIFISS